MQPGDVCRCLNNFNGSLPGELILLKDDIVQVYQVLDKIWVEGIAAGVVGKFPSSNIVKVDLHVHMSHLDLLVVIADFEPNLQDEIPLKRGTFVYGHHQIDDNWWFGECYGKKGAFPTNFVWKVRKELMTDENQVEEIVTMRAKVMTSVKAQLPEEIDLYAGDIVTISAIIDKDWYRGESCGNRGIFHSNFVVLLQDSELNLAQEDRNETWQHPTVLSDLTPDIVVLDYSENQSISLETEILQPPTTLKTDDSWKSLESEEQKSLFEDDYFKQNMSSFYKLSNKDTELNLVKPSDSICVSSKGLNIFEDSSHLNSLSYKVEKYFTNDDRSSILNPDTLQDLMDIDFTTVYTEDNTGINPYGRAIFSFLAQYENELSFKKGDIIHLIKHIDSHWTVGSSGIKNGIFPTSYIDVIVDCPQRVEQQFESKPKFPREFSFLGHALVCFGFEAMNVDEVSVETGDIVILKRYVTDDWVEVQKEEGHFGIVPLNHLKLSEKGSFPHKEINKEPLDLSAVENLQNLPIKAFAHQKKQLQVVDQSTTNIDRSTTNIDQSTTNIDQSTTNIDQSTTKIDKSTSSIPNTNSRFLNNEVLSPLYDIPGNSTKTVPVTLTSDKQTPLPVSAEIGNDEIPVLKYNHSAVISQVSCANFPMDVLSNAQKDSTKKIELHKMAPKRPAPPKPLEKSDDEDFSSYGSNSDVCCADQENSSDTQSSEEKKSESELPKCLKMRRESVNELVTTEHEYIHDLEALIQVVKINKKSAEAANIDLKVLMGNIVEIVNFSKKFVSKLDAVSYEESEGSCIGPVFIDVADEMCDVYKVYSSNNSISVGLLLKKYQEGSNSVAFLNLILTELRQYKVNLLDIHAVLIKPVQRVLKYPLFLDQLVRHTPSGHPDHKKLQEAKAKLLNVAKEINEYTKRLDLVVKYKSNSSHSISDLMQKVSMRSVAKKGSRFRTRLSASMGFLNQTRDLKFEDEEIKFHSLVKATKFVHNLGDVLLKSVLTKHKSELGMIEAIALSLLTRAKNPIVEEVRTSCRDACNRLLPTFENVVQSRVIQPTKALLNMCSAPERLISKRADKLTDYDAAQHKLDRNRDPSRIRILEEELKQAKGNYEAFNKQMLLELPVLNASGLEILNLAIESLVSSRMNLEGRIAKLYLDLAELPEFSFKKNPDFLVNFKTQCFNEASQLKKISFLPGDFYFKSPKFGRKSSFRTMGKDVKKRISLEKLLQHRRSVLEKKYDLEQLYTVVVGQKADNIHELDVKVDTVVAVLKTKDPLGREDKWFVDDGDKKGFVKAAILKKYKPSRKSVSPQSRSCMSKIGADDLAAANSSHLSREKALPEDEHVLKRPQSLDESILERLQSVDESVVLERPQAIAINEECIDDPSIENTIAMQEQQRQASRALIAMNPPRYEDLFPGTDSKDVSQSPHCDIPPAEEGPVLYDEPSNILPAEGSAAQVEYKESEDDINKVTDESERHYSNVDLPDGSSAREEPIYETIPEDLLERFTEPQTSSLVCASNEKEPRFYYSLYHFGGSDINQLTLYEGQVVLRLTPEANEWWFVEDRRGNKGYVPSSYLAKYN